jgi:flagellar motor switch protein FliN/FliY
VSGGAGLTQRDALVRLGASTAEAIAQVLEMFAPGAIERGDVSVLAEGANPFSSLTRGAVATSVSYVDGVTGANVFALTPAGARNLASAMGVPAPDPPADDGGKPEALSELELSAISEAANQMMAAAASAIGVVLGQEIEISPPETRVIEDPAATGELFGSSAHATSTTFLIGGESCRLIQLVPSAFVVRMARALDELGADGDDDGGGESRDDGEGSTTSLVDALGEIKLRVWAELGRTQLPLGRALGLPLGAVVELDRTAESPVELFVNGMSFAQGRLIVTDDGEWAFACDAVGSRGLAGPPITPTQPEHEGAQT